jgi:hypothetical protein
MQKGSKTILDYDSDARRFPGIILATLALSIFAILLANVSRAQNRQQSQPPEQQSPLPPKAIYTADGASIAIAPASAASIAIQNLY